MLRRHENDIHKITPVLRLLNLRNLPSIGWIKIENWISHSKQKLTTFDRELECSFDDINPLTRSDIPQLKILSFDTEEYSRVYSAMPLSSEPKDCVIQISAVITPFDGNPLRKILFALR